MRKNSRFVLYKLKNIVKAHGIVEPSPGYQRMAGFLAGKKGTEPE
ncbi:hypothetical protein [Methanocella sp. MCL-LM]